MATGSQIAAPQEAARSSGDPRRTSLRWPSQGPTKVATASQFAARQGRPGRILICVGHRSADLPEGPRNRRRFRSSQPPRDGEVSIECAYDIIPLGVPGAHERGDGLVVHSPQGRRGLILMCVGQHSARPPRSLQAWRQLRSSRPPRTARSQSSARTTSLRWASQEPRTWRQFRSSQPPSDGEASF